MTTLFFSVTLHLKSADKKLVFQNQTQVEAEELDLELQALLTEWKHKCLT